MDPRIFGKEITNILKNDNIYKRNYSLVHDERPRNQSLHNCKPNVIIVPPKLINKTLVEQQEKIRQEQPRLYLNDPQMVPEYLIQNIQFMKRKEKQGYKLTNYLLTHKTVSEQSRAKLIDWLCSLHYKYKMFPETLYTIVSIIDQYLSLKEVSLSRLQLVGVAALYISAKFEETYQVPPMKQLVTCCAGQYTPTQILQMEADIIKELKFELIVNSAFKFFQPLAKITGLGLKNKHLAQYVLQLAFFRPKLLEYPPSLMASAVIYLIKRIRKSESTWNELMTQLVGYKQSQLKSCAKDLCGLLQSAHDIQHSKSLKKKFSTPEFHEVTRIRLERKESK